MFAQLSNLYEETMTVLSGHGVSFPLDGGIVRIDDELISYGTYRNNVFYDIGRGYRGTDNVVHDSGVPVYLATEHEDTIDYNKYYFGEDLSLTENYSFNYEDGTLETITGSKEFSQYLLLLAANTITKLYESGQELTIPLVENAFVLALGEDRRIVTKKVLARAGTNDEMIGIRFFRYGDTGLFMGNPKTPGACTIVVETTIVVPHIGQELGFSFGLGERVRL